MSLQKAIRIDLSRIFWDSQRSVQSNVFKSKRKIMKQVNIPSTKGLDGLKIRSKDWENTYVYYYNSYYYHYYYHY